MTPSPSPSPSPVLAPAASPSRTPTALGLPMPLWILLCLGALLRLSFLTAEGFWFDEFCIWRQVHMTFPDMLDDLVHNDVHPPLYQALMWSWSNLWGLSDEPTLRLPSAIFGVLTLIPLYFLAQTLSYTPSSPQAPAHTPTKAPADTPAVVAAVAATAWLAVNEFAVYYSQEARSYSLLLMLSVCSALTWRRLKQSEQEHGRLSGRPSARAIGAYSVAAILTAYAHVFGILLIGYFGFVDLISVLRKRASWGGLIRSYAAIALGVALWIPGLIVQTQRVQKGFWIPKPSFGFWIDYLSSYAGHGLLALAVAASVGAGVWAQRRRGEGSFWREMGWVVGWGAWMLLVPFVLSRIGQPMMHDKSAISVVAVMSLLVGWSAREAWSTWGRRPWTVGAAVIWLTASTASVIWGVYIVQSREAWREMTTAVEQEARAGDVVVLYHPEDDYFDCYRYYLDPAIQPVEAKCKGGEGCAAKVAEVEARWQAAGSGGDVWLLKVRARGDWMDGLDARWQVAETRQMINGELQRLRRIDGAATQ